ncbi:uncharacterized protein [Argopecten irradians]|uniref:uncharacterized protein n=1 Tax=Argopecten irradians TaxID=31199 RepID=UPI00371CC692
MDARFLHTAVDMGDYMVVMGGRTDSSNFSNRGDLAFSRPLHSVVAPSSAVVNNSIYVMGGLDHFVHSEVIKLDLPSDVCSLIGDLNRCINSSGCSACILSSPGIQNRTFCYSNSPPRTTTDKYSCRCQANFDGGANYTIELLPWFYQAVPRLRGLFGQWNRYGHTLTACGDELIYMFGGHSLEKGLLNDLWVFNITKNKWNQIMPITIDEPEGRYYHSAACIPIKRQLFIYGGFIKDRASTQDSDGTQDTAGNQKYRTKYRASNELWSFSIGGRKWTRMSVPALVKPVAGHTMTRIEETQLLIIGGILYRKLLLQQDLQV